MELNNKVCVLYAILPIYDSDRAKYISNIKSLQRIRDQRYVLKYENLFHNSINIVPSDRNPALCDISYNLIELYGCIRFQFDLK